MLRFLFVFSVPTFSSYNPDIAKKGASSGGVTPPLARARGPNQGGFSENRLSLKYMRDNPWRSPGDPFFVTAKKMAIPW